MVARFWWAINWLLHFSGRTGFLSPPAAYSALEFRIASRSVRNKRRLMAFDSRLWCLTHFLALEQASYHHLQQRNTPISSKWAVIHGGSISMLNSLPDFSAVTLATCRLEILYYRVWSFKTRGTKLDRFLHKNQHSQRETIEHLELD